jgi:hypothetical protein
MVAERTRDLQANAAAERRARQARRAQDGGRTRGTSKLRHALAHPGRSLTAAVKI